MIEYAHFSEGGAFKGQKPILKALFLLIATLTETHGKHYGTVVFDPRGV
jgi:hypothetical protein